MSFPHGDVSLCHLKFAAFWLVIRLSLECLLCDHSICGQIPTSDIPFSFLSLLTQICLWPYYPFVACRHQFSLFLSPTSKANSSTSVRYTVSWGLQSIRSKSLSVGPRGGRISLYPPRHSSLSLWESLSPTPKSVGSW